MQLSTYSLPQIPPQPKEKMNLTTRFPDISAELRAKKALVDSKLFKNIQFIDISRSKKAEKLMQKHRTWPVYRKTGQIDYINTFQNYNTSRLRNRYLKLFLLFVGFGVFIYLFFELFEITTGRL